MMRLAPAGKKTDVKAARTKAKGSSKAGDKASAKTSAAKPASMTNTGIVENTVRP